MLYADASELTYTQQLLAVLCVAISAAEHVPPLPQLEAGGGGGGGGAAATVILALPFPLPPVPVQLTE